MTERKLLIVLRSRKPLIAPLVPFRLFDAFDASEGPAKLAPMRFAVLALALALTILAQSATIAQEVAPQKVDQGLLRLRQGSLAGIEQSHPRVGLQVRRLEVGTFQFPFAETGRKEIAAWELGLLLEGIDLGKGQRRKRYSLPTGRPEGPVTTGPEEAPETS